MRTAAAAWLVIPAIVAAAVDGGVAGETRLSQILDDPASFDGQSVVLEGTLTKLQTHLSRKGDRYYSFRLSDGGRHLFVVAQGRPECGQGMPVTIEGRFERATKRVDATAVRC